MNYSSIARNTMIAFAAQFISLSVSVVMSLLVPKIVGVADYGYWQLFMFYTTYSGFFHLGLNDGVYLINGGLSRDQISIYLRCLFSSSDLPRHHFGFSASCR